ncbi:uncharacterized membrane protein (DUF485 family) [Chryseobacterium defluvii]|uniref:Uncharacterized membrane protein (DUF485 family) n=1 Tax=Chryseobacterium defluvii TaxID=160396 RepID=A0A840K825_9FLAO|nr:DUF3667 domain-containing protein [Chryseobacterium defluvii]MBB4805409.1 uncharacterized membrane protein (DUF485 family) [Chryseobacterium defluvii]
MTNKNCLNCEKELTDKFCAGCGQKADTHRISFRHFILHDLLHGTFHIDKGILFTAKQALIRPGKAALDYISGKRIRYYNIFYLTLIIIGVMIFFRHVDELIYGRVSETANKTYINEASKKINEFIAQNNKFIIFLFVPLGALNSFILFRRKKLNLSEHAIISGMILLGILLLQTFINIYFNFNHLVGLSNSVASFIATVGLFFYVGYGYYNAFNNDYSKLGISYRIVLFFMLLGLETIILTYILIGFMTHWKMGPVTLSPFG